MLISQY